MEKVDQEIRAPLKPKDGTNLSDASSGHRRLIHAQLTLRVAIVFVTSVIVAVMASTPHSPDSLAHGLFMGGNIVACVLALLPLVSFVPYLVCGRQISSNHVSCLYVHDLIWMVLLLGYNAAAYMIEFVGLDGQQSTLTPEELCNQAPNSCSNVVVSMVLSCVAIGLAIILIALSPFHATKKAVR